MSSDGGCVRRYPDKPLPDIFSPDLRKVIKCKTVYVVSALCVCVCALIPIACTERLSRKCHFRSTANILWRLWKGIITLCVCAVIPLTPDRWSTFRCVDLELMTGASLKAQYLLSLDPKASLTLSLPHKMYSSTAQIWQRSQSENYNIKWRIVLIIVSTGKVIFSVRIVTERKRKVLEQSEAASYLTNPICV